MLSVRTTPDSPFRLTGGATALVSATLVAAILFTNVRCPACNGLVMAIPGAVPVTVTVLPATAHRTGRGRVVACHKRHLIEVVEHGRG